MGAIAAYLAAAAEPSTRPVEVMTSVVPHRGERVETLLHGRCAIACVNGTGHDDAELGVASRIAAAFAGTLDNAADLRRDLVRRRLAAPESSRAELIAAGFVAYGKDLPSRLRGVFSGIVTDGRRAYAFRDHLGYGLLFYRDEESGFYAGTEAKQVAAGAAIRREPDLEVVDSIFFNGHGDDTPCALRGVRRLPKAHGIMAGSAPLELHRYWDPEALLETARISDADLHQRFAELFDQAVSRCLTGDDLISLSGGIDSPAVAAFAAPRHLELSGRPLSALSAVYPRFPSVDERPYIELLADHFRIPLRTFEQQANVLDDLEHWVTLADGPFPAAALAHYAEDYRLARNLGFRTILTGEHAEFVFALNWYIIDHYLSHGRLRDLRRHLEARHAKGAPWPWLAFDVARGMAPGRLLAARERRTRMGLPAWIDGVKASEGLARGIASARQRWRRLQLSAFTGPGLSGEAEAICQAACGVRVRRPWTDVDLFEFFLSLPAAQKFPDTGGKSLVKRFMRGRVPDTILDRKHKTVFDEALLSQIDYVTLRRFLVDPPHRLGGIDYAALAERLRREDFEPPDFHYARQLAGVHAFLAQS
ncbi:MAG: asparagine synthase-related protein [Chloroflexota bacterium]|nr:asparagine synthase-related protein [Chloroflexota bacterium]